MKAGPALFDLDGFEYFWSFYPRKENKLQARKAWAKLRPAPNSMLLEAIRTWIEAAELSEQWRERRFIPHPSTFINQRRWESDPPPVSRQRASAMVGLSAFEGGSWTSEELEAARKAKVEAEARFPKVKRCPTR